MKQDFFRLYSQLGLHPDCSLEEFKQAYRRRIAEVHPDKAAAPGNTDSTSLDVSELNSAYAAALSFHKRQGRLPGSKPHAPATPRKAALRYPTPPKATPATGIPSTSSGRGNLLVALLIALIMVMILMDFSSETLGLGASGEGTADTQSTAAHLEPPPPTQLVLGMDATEAIIVQGQPHQIRGDEWSYGPSWLKFEKGRLVDWHSSPLRRLRTDTQNPPKQPPPSE